jgi:hypothetical protein
MSLGLCRCELRDAGSSEAWELGRCRFLGHAGGPARTSVRSVNPQPRGSSDGQRVHPRADRRDPHPQRVCVRHLDWRQVLPSAVRDLSLGGQLYSSVIADVAVDELADDVRRMTSGRHPSSCCPAVGYGVAATMLDRSTSTAKSRDRDIDQVRWVEPSPAVRRLAEQVFSDPALRSSLAGLLRDVSPSGQGCSRAPKLSPLPDEQATLLIETLSRLDESDRNAVLLGASSESPALHRTASRLLALRLARTAVG